VDVTSTQLMQHFEENVRSVGMGRRGVALINAIHANKYILVMFSHVFDAVLQTVLVIVNVIVAVEANPRRLLNYGE
jgi:hypothetical protein